MQITNNFNLPEPVYLALTHDDYSKGESNRSVTQLIESPRYIILKHEHEDEITQDVSELIWIAMGKTIHKMFEKYAHGRYTPEQRLYADINGWNISGQIDLQELSDGSMELSDYKCTSVYTLIFYNREASGGKYDSQLNFYAWLAENGYIIVNGVKAPNVTLRVSSLKVVLVLRDWRKSDAAHDKSYPQAPIVELTIPLWRKEIREEYVYERVELHQEVEFLRLTGQPLPYCTDEERWRKPASYAVKKPANKKAKRVFSSLEKAQQHITDEGLDGFVIETRESIPKRCADGWCPSAPWCDQWQAEKGKVDVEPENPDQE